MRLIPLAIAVLLLGLPACAQTPADQDQQANFTEACVAGALKAGCPPVHPQSNLGQQPVVHPPSTDHSLDHALDKPVPTFTLPVVAPATDVATPTPAPANDSGTVTLTPLRPATTHLRPILLSRTDKACGPMIPPNPGELTMQYSINRNRCLRELRGEAIARQQAAVNSRTTPSRSIPAVPQAVSAPSTPATAPSPAPVAAATPALTAEQKDAMSYCQRNPTATITWNNGRVSPCSSVLDAQ